MDEGNLRHGLPVRVGDGHELFRLVVEGPTRGSKLPQDGHGGEVGDGNRTVRNYLLNR